MAYTDIDDPSAYFQTTLYTGDGNGSGQAITHGGNSDLQADFIWIKNRTDAENHSLTDSVRGGGKGVLSNSPDPQTTNNSNGYLSSFNSDGFTTANAGVYNNASSKNYVSWNWKKVAGVFDIQTYSGASNTRTISHNLGSVPKAMIFKRLDDGAWIVYHADAGGANKYLVLNTSAAVDTATTLFNNTVPTSSVFSVGNTNSTNGSSIDYVVYLIGNKQGVSRCGSYTGNGNADGTYVYLGFKPALVIYKNITNAREWILLDNKRLGYNPNNNSLFPNNSDTDADGSAISADLLSNGFKLRTTSEHDNESGNTFIYIAFAEESFVSSGGVPATAR